MDRWKMAVRFVQDGPGFAQEILSRSRKAIAAPAKCSQAFRQHAKASAAVCAGPRYRRQPPFPPTPGAMQATAANRIDGGNAGEPDRCRNARRSAAGEPGWMSGPFLAMPAGKADQPRRLHRCFSCAKRRCERCDSADRLRPGGYRSKGIVGIAISVAVKAIPPEAGRESCRESVGMLWTLRGVRPSCPSRAPREGPTRQRDRPFGRRSKADDRSSPAAFSCRSRSQAAPGEASGASLSGDALREFFGLGAPDASLITTRIRAGSTGFWVLGRRDTQDAGSRCAYTRRGIRTQ